MSNQESSSNNTSSSAPEQIPHSGVHGFEKPVREFDKTPLADAVDRGLVKIPKGLGETPDTHARPQIDLDSKKTGSFKKAGVALAGLGLAAAGFFGAKAMGGDSPNNEPNVEPSASAPANPGETNTAEQPAEALDFSLDSERYAGNPEAIMQDFFDTLNEWQNTGASVKVAGADERFTMSDEDYAAKLNKASDDAFTKDVLADNWQDNEKLAEWYYREVSNHNTNTVIALKTSLKTRKDSDLYKRYVDLDHNSVRTTAGDINDKIVVSGTWTGRDNSELNDGDEIGTGVDPNAEHGKYTLTFVKAADGTMRLSDIQY